MKRKINSVNGGREMRCLLVFSDDQEKVNAQLICTLLSATALTWVTK